MSYVTNDYMINKDLLNSYCNPFNKTKGEPVTSNQCSGQSCCNSKVKYTCVMSTSKCWNNNNGSQEAFSNNQIVANNILQGSFNCEFKPRNNINNRLCGRNQTSLVTKPFENDNLVETEYYLIHGINSKTNCNKEWLKRHAK